MSTNLYEILEIQADATPEQIRRAYKKRALQTHPDRAPASEKAQAEERFRQVNNAYQVLNDPQKRLSYDRHGTWPPPAENSAPQPQNDPRSYPFQPNVFAFTDPFEVFETFFGHVHPFQDPFPFGPPRTFPDPFFPPTGPSFLPGGPFEPFHPNVGMGSGVFHDVLPPDPFMPPMMRGGLHPQGAGNMGRPSPHFSSPYPTNRGTNDGQWISESHSTTTINGFTTSVHERVDFSGNIHTTTTHPDGRETHTINGIPQASRGVSTPPLPPYEHRPNPRERPRRHPNHHSRHDNTRGRHNRHRPPHDREYFPDNRDPRRPDA